MRKRFRFVGTYAEIGGTVYSRFGQYADLTEDYWVSVTKGDRGAPLIPEHDFQAIGFEWEDLDRWAEYSNRDMAPASFQEKVKKALLVLDQIRKDLSEPNDGQVSGETEAPAASE